MTPVMANILMVAVLVGVSLAVYALLTQFEDASRSPDRRQGSFTVDLGPGDRAFHLLYVRGEAIPLDDGILYVTVDGTRTGHPLREVEEQTADEDWWTVGEAICVVGPDDHCLYASASSVEVTLVVEDDVMFQAQRELRA